MSLVRKARAVSHCVRPDSPARVPAFSVHTELARNSGSGLTLSTCTRLVGKVVTQYVYRNRRRCRAPIRALLESWAPESVSETPVVPYLEIEKRTENTFIRFPSRSRASFERFPRFAYTILRLRFHFCTRAFCVSQTFRRLGIFLITVGFWCS